MVFTPPPPVVIYLWLIVSQGVFCSPWVGSVGLVFSQPLGLWSFCSPRLDPVEANLPLAFLGYGGLFICISLFFLSFDRIVHFKMSSLGDWPSQRVVGGMIFWPFFSPFFLWFWKPNLHFLANFWLTRAPQPRSQSSSSPGAARSGRVDCRRSVHGAHAPGSSLLFGARVGHAPPFLGRSRWQLVIRRRTSVWVAPVLARVLHAPRSGILAPFLHCRQIVLGGFCLSVLVFFSLVSRVTVCLCLIQILWEYLLANC
jgi:hypothetical protein